MNAASRPKAAHDQRHHDDNPRAGGSALRDASAATIDGQVPILEGIPDYPVEALPEAARALVRRATDAGLPASLVGGAAVGAMAAAIGSSAQMDVLSNERATLWLPLIAPAGAGKSPAQALAFGPLREHDAAATDDECILLGDLTLEAVARELDAVGGAAALDVDELPVLLRGLGEYKRAGGGDRARFLALWTGAPWRFTRVGAGGKRNALRLRIQRPTVVICGGLQPHLHELLGSDEDGSRARWLPHVAPLPTWQGDLVPTAVAPAEWRELLNALIELRAVSREWRLTDAAARCLMAHRSRWKSAARGTETATVSTALGKADVHLARIALVLAEAERPGKAGRISPETVDRAAMLVDYTLDCWRALPAVGGLALSRKDETLDRGILRLIAWLDNHGGLGTRRDLQQARVAGARTAEELAALLDRYGAVYPECVTEERSSRGGPPTILVRSPSHRPAPTVDSGNGGNSRQPNPPWGSDRTAESA